MNKQLYRVIFSKHLQRLVVVSEKTRSQGKSGSQGGSEPSAGLGESQIISQNLVNAYYGKWATLCGAVLIGLGLANLSYANTNNNPPTTIITDPTALKSEQATILTTASGLTQVNIQTPSGAGVSKNTFSQFDVGNAGAILNNSRTNTNTQLAGFVQGNPWLATGEAKVILNQVNSVNPSYLGGYVEIAGKKADIIIANPSGLQINGAGFINAGNVNLVAGTSVMQNGQLSAYKVDTGTIDVQGKLNTKDTNYTALIAKAIQINDEVYAGNQLDVITGENTIPLKEGQLTNLDPVNRRATTQTNQATNEGVALDISSLGGMYAGKIRLVGTDKGFGVTNAGIIQATGHGGAGSLSLDSQGNLSNAGSIFAKDKVAINAHHNDIQNAGNITSKQDDIIINSDKLGNTGAIQGTQTTAITTANTIDNAGIIQSGVLQLQSKELDNTGSIAQTGLGKLAITTKTLNNHNQAIIGQSLYTTDNNLNTGTGTTAVPSTVGNSQTGVNVATTPNQTNTNANTQVVSTPTANGFISAANIIDNTGNKAQIQANGDIDITTDSVNNADKSSIDVTALSTQSVGNTDSKIALDNINWQLTSFDNSKGDIVARDKMVIASQSSIINTEGRLVADSMVLDAKSELDNSDGVVQSAGDVSVAASKVTNNQGIIHGAHALMINANGILTNNAGVISSSQNTTITAKTAIDNTDGRIQSDGKLNVNAQQLNSTGTIYAAQGTAITASHVNNEQTGLIASANDVSINTQNLTSAGTISAGMQSDGKLGNTPANISIQATEGIHSSGNAIATGTLTLNANTINLDDSDNQADNITLLAQDTISTRKTSTVASNSLAITAPNKLDNSEGILSANEMIVNTDVLENRQGTISQAGKTALSLAIKRSIDNTLGTISTNSDALKIETNQLINQQGAIHHAGVGELNVKSENLNNSQGELLSLGTQTLNINKIINNSQGVISATSFAINADGLDNTAGLLQATDKDADNLLNIDSTLDNNKLAEQQGSIDVAGNLTLAAKTLQNQGAITTNNLKATVANVNNTGAIGARGNIQIASSQDIDNTGNISATGNIVLNANNTISHQGVMMAADSITATANRLNFNQSTSSADNISLSAQADIHHNQATTVANNKLSLKNTSAIYNQDGVLSANHTSIDTKDLQNGGIIQADVLTIKQQADYTHTDNDKLLANNLQFSTDGKIINQSQLIANQDLTLSANHIDNTQTGTISSGNHTQITSQTSINNQGLINGETTVIKANDTINNQSGGRIYGTHLAIQADTLNNTPAKVKESDSKYTAPVIAARERLDIGVKTLNNNPNPDRAGKFNENFDNQALITSLGSLHIGGNLDDNHYATGKADAVINKGATIESGGEMVVDTKTLLNGNADFKKHKVEVVEESVRGQTLYRNREQSGVIPTTLKSTDVADLGKKPMAGLFDCPEGSDCLVNYDNDSKIWSYFNIKAPTEPMPTIAAKDILDEPELPKGEDAQSCALAGVDNQACTLYKEELAHYTKVMGPLLKWEEENSTAIEALELAIREYNRQFAKSDTDLALNIYTTDEAYLGPTSRKGAPTGALYVKQENGSYRRVGEEIDEITTDFVVYEDKTLASDPARMVAGANLVVYGDTLINDKSQMSAGAGFLVVGDTVVQTPDNGLYGEKVKQTENGRYVSRTVVSSAAGRRHKRIDIGGGVFVQEFAPLATYQLPILNATINTTPVSTQRTLDALSSNDNQALLDALKANQANLSATAQEQLTALLSAKQSGQNVDESVLASLVDELKHSIANNQAVVVTATDNTISLPNSSLYTINADNPNLPVVQTDPAFTNYKQWLSSDYMLKAIQSDPNHIHKRLSDGYGEQARIKDQYQLLTGRHINTDYRNQEEAYQALMDNGITHAKQFNYTLGMALTAEQMANLTSDIVWLVKESVTYTIKDKEGNLITKTEEVLVPKLYLRSATTDTATLTKDGRLSTISGKNMDIRLTGNLDNNGNFIAKDTISITADNATNKGVIKGNYVAIETKNNIVNHNQIYADSAARLIAGNDIINESLTTTKQSVVGRSRAKNTAITQIATISVGKGLQGATDNNGNPLTTLSLRGNQIIYQGAASDNAGDGTTQITATNGIKLDTVTQTNQLHAVGDDNNYFKYDSSKELGSSVTGVGNVVLATTGENADIIGVAATINSQGTTAIISTDDVEFSEGRMLSGLETANKMTSRNLVSKKTVQNFYKEDSDISVQSQIGGNQVSIQSGGDTHLTDTQVLADNNVAIRADGKLVIDAAKNTQIIEQQNIVKKSGLVSISTNGITIGKQSTNGENQQEIQYHTGSTVAALDGNVTLSAGESYQQVGSSIQAYSSTPQPTTQGSGNNQSGNIKITAKTVDILNATDSQTTNSDYKFKQSGVSVTVSNPVLDLALNSHEVYQVAKKINDPRSYRLAALDVGLDSYMLYANRKELKDPPTQLNNIDSKNPQKPHDIAKDFKIAVSVGTQSNESHSASYKEINKASELKANNLSIHAVDEQDGNINIVGSQVMVQNNALLAANNEINILSSVQEQHSHSNNKSKSASIGVDFSVGTNTGIGVNASGSVGRGNADSVGQTHSNSHLAVGNNLVMSSGNDTNIKGAIVKVEQLSLDVGGDFNLHSQQDEYSSDSKHRQYGGSVSVGVKTAPISGSINIGMDDGRVNYRGVQEQTTLQAGAGGFDINVKGKTDMKGSTITSEADKSKNQLITGSFTHEDITNISEAKAKTRSYGVDSSALSGNLYPVAKTVIDNAFGNTSDNHYDVSQTISAIADGTLIAKDDKSQQRLDNITNDTTNTHRIIAPVNIDEMMEDVKARQFLKDATVDIIFKYSDEAHKKMFIAEAPLYRITKDAEGNPIYTKIEGKEKEELLKQQDGRVHVFTNGIMNDAEAAGIYAVQNRRDENAKLGQELDLNENPVYFVHFPKTNNVVSEMMVAAYQKFLESDALGLTNATKEVKSIMQTYGETGLQMDGHSRGTLTITNAYSSLLNDGDAGKYSNLRTNMVGAAANINNANRKLAELQGRNDEVLSTDPMNDTAQFKPVYTEAEKSEMTIHFQGHTADPVHRVIGLNKPTGGTVSTEKVGKPKETALIIKEAGRSVLGKETTAHNCYGVGSKECAEAGLLKNGKPMKWKPVYKPKVITTPTTPQTQNLCKDLTDSNIQKCNSNNN